MKTYFLAVLALEERNELIKLSSPNQLAMQLISFSILKSSIPLQNFNQMENCTTRQCLMPILNFISVFLLMTSLTLWWFFFLSFELHFLKKKVNGSDDMEIVDLSHWLQMQFVFYKATAGCLSLGCCLPELVEQFQQTLSFDISIKTILFLLYDYDLKKKKKVSFKILPLLPT